MKIVKDRVCNCEIASGAGGRRVGSRVVTRRFKEDQCNHSLYVEFGVYGIRLTWERNKLIEVRRRRGRISRKERERGRRGCHADGPCSTSP